MENVVVENRLVNVAVRVQRVRVPCLLQGQPLILALDMHKITLFNPSQCLDYSWDHMFQELVVIF